MKDAPSLLAREPEHPLLPLPSREKLREWSARPDGSDVLGRVLLQRRQLIQRAAEEPLKYELEPNPTTVPWLPREVGYWEDVRAAIRNQVRGIAVLGGNRSGKSWLCGKLTMESLVEHPGTEIVCLAKDETNTISTQQAILWHFLPPELKALNGQRDKLRTHYINHSEANGFSERRIVLPRPKGYHGRPSRVWFATYGESPDDYEGFEFGNLEHWGVNWWADENMPLNWLLMLKRRGAFRPGTGLWSFTPIHGITPSVKYMLGSGCRVLRSAPASLLRDRVNVPGLPAGHMPYEQESAIDGWRVFYFFTEFSPFHVNGQRYIEVIARDCAGKPSDYVMQTAYGYCRDIRGRVFPGFSGVHVVDDEQLPAPGHCTQYQFIDPHPRRAWATLWLLVSEGNPGRIYITRDWPDRQTYDDWAVPTQRATSADSRKGWDGDEGPAQRALEMGYAEYKLLWMKLEAGEDGLGAFRADVATEERYLDPRAAKNPHAEAVGGTCLLEQLEVETPLANGESVPAMAFCTAKGLPEEQGNALINSALAWNKEQPFDLTMNAPRLFVHRRCQQVIWALENYTGMGGETGACKDWIDLLRYALTSDLTHVTPRMRRGKKGWAY